MKKNAVRNFIYGMLAGMLLFVLVTLLLNVFGIRVFSTSSLADNIRSRARVVESYIDRYYWKDDVSDQKISEYAAKGMVAALEDKYSVYYTDDELDQSLEDVEGDYGVMKKQEKRESWRFRRGSRQRKPDSEPGT